MWLSSCPLPPGLTAYGVHQEVWKAFPATDRERTFCYSDSGQGHAVVYSTHRPSLPDARQWAIAAGTTEFLLEASVSRGTYRDAAGKRQRMTQHKDPRHACEWLQRRMPSARFEHVAAQRLSPIRIQRPGGGTPMFFNRWCFTGVITVLDPEAFEATLCAGIGQGSAFGLGLMHFLDKEPITCNP